jgi:hypothetical protein
MTEENISEPYINIKMYTDCVEVDTGNSLSTSSKIISINDFLKTVSKEVVQPNSEEAFSLPPNCIRFSRTTQGIKLSTYFPAKKQDLKYKKSYDPETIYKVAAPNIILSFTLDIKPDNSYYLKDIRYFCTDLGAESVELLEQVPTEKDHLKHIWILPFSNIYNDGHMCYGGNTTPRVFSKNLKGLHYYYTMLFDTPFNDDLSINDTTFRGNVSSWYKILEDAETFPYYMLRDSPHLAPTPVANDLSEILPTLHQLA